jgi:hypothetical protein
VAAGSFRIVAGPELVREWVPEDHGWPKCFCSACGSALWSRSPAEPGIVSVRLGTFDSDPQIRPQWHQFVAYAASWEALPDDGLPRYDERPPS